MTLKYTVLRGRYYHFRKVVPQRLRKRIKSKEITFSLRTTSKTQATLHAFVLNAYCDRLFSIAMTDGLTDSDIKQMTLDFFERGLHLIEQQKRKNKHDEKRFLNDFRKADHHALKEYDKQFDELFNNIAIVGEEEFVEYTILDILNGEGKEKHIQNRLRTLQERIDDYFSSDDQSIEELSNIVAETLLINKGLDVSGLVYTSDFKVFRSLVRRSINELRRIALNVSNHTLDISQQESKNTSDSFFSSTLERYHNSQNFINFSELYNLYLADNKSLSDDSRKKKQAAFDYMISIVGDKDIRAYTKKDAREFKATLHKLPSNFNKIFSNADMRTIAQSDHGQRTLSTGTISNYLSQIRSIFQWAIDNGYLELNNVFSGINVKIERKKALSFSNEDIRDIFSFPFFAGCQSDTSQGRLHSGDVMLFDADFFVPFVAAHSGARLSEIVDTYVEDIKRDNDSGIYYIDLTEYDRKGKKKRSFKTAASIRKIPLNKKLIDVGFLAYVEKKRSKQRVMLFDELATDKQGQRAQYYQKRFNRILVDRMLQFERNEHTRKTFHSFRHTFKDMLRLLHSALCADSGEVV